MEVVGKVGSGRDRKTWLQCVISDKEDLGLRVEEAQDRKLCRRTIFGETSEPCMHGKKILNRKNHHHHHHPFSVLSGIVHASVGKDVPNYFS